MDMTDAETESEWKFLLLYINFEMMTWNVVQKMYTIQYIVCLAFKLL